MNLRYQFFAHLANTSPEPLAIEIDRTLGNYLYSGEKAYLDLIGGISVANIGHTHPQVVQAIKEQADKYLHVMVYGELILSPQVKYATRLIELLGQPFEKIYFTNSGAEANEAAMKVAKRYTGRANIIAFHHSYHGSTQGALSMIGDEYWRQRYRPLLPGIKHYTYNDFDVIQAIDSHTAAVFIEPIQAEAGVLSPHIEWLQALHYACKSHGVLLIMDEVQTGFGRTGTLFAYQKWGIIPDIIVLGKALGGGMPLGAICASAKLLDSFISNPVLGHITTFGGHPMSCAAGLASLDVLLQSKIIDQVREKEQILLKELRHPKIIKLNTCGLWAAVFVEDSQILLRWVHSCISEGLFTDWFLFAPNALRISPPLTITSLELIGACKTMVRLLDEI